MNLLTEAWVQRLGWVLIHFLWEGTIIALLLGALLRLLTKASSHARYAFAGITLLLCVIAPAITWAMLAPHEEGSSPTAEIGSFHLPQSQDGIASPSIGLPTSLQAPVEPKKPWQVRLVYAADASLPYAVGLWFVGVIILSLRLTLGWIWMKRLCRSGIPAKDPRCLEKFESLLTRMQIDRSVRLLESALVEVPTLIGWLRPTILIPVSLFVGMTPDQLEAIFAHELAHVRRYDYLVNLFQTVIETILFYHPAVWWISRKLREERENCCDDIALEAMQDRLVYVRALAQLEAGRTPPLALTASGGSLLHRIRRIAGANDRKISAWPLGLMVLVLIMVAGISIRTAQADAPVKEATNTVKTSVLTKALIDAAKQGDVTHIDLLLKQGANPNTYPKSERFNALFAAAESNHVEAAKLLLNNGADPNCQNDCTNPVLNWVLDQGHLEMATVLHDVGAKLSPMAWAGATGDLGTLKSMADSGTLKKGKTDEAMKYAVSMGQLDTVKFLEGIEGKPIAGKYLSQAARSGNISMMEYILSRGANIKTDGGAAVDMAVIFYEQPEAVKWLLAHGADPNRLSGWQQYSLAEARTPAMMKVLLKGGANPNVEDMFGTPLSMAPDVESVRLLVQHSANLKPKLKNGVSLIESVISRGLQDKPDVIEELIKQGAEFDPQGNGASALVKAAAVNQVLTMQVLLEHGVSPNAFSDEPFMKTSALANAAWEPSPEAVKLLLAKGANPSGDPRDNATPLAMAVLFGETESVNLLRNAGAHDVGDLSLVAALGEESKVDDLLKNGTTINETDNAGNTPLYYAVRRGHVEVTKLLMEHGANVNQFDTWGITPQGCFEMMDSHISPMKSQMDWGVREEEGNRRTAAFKELFAKHPADPNYRDGKGRTALHQAAFGGFTELPMGDKAHPANPNILDNDGNTPLLLAVLSPHASDLVTRISVCEDPASPQKITKDWNATAYIVDRLIRAGAKLNLKMSNGQTQGELAMSAAVKAKNPQLISVLHDAGVAASVSAPKTTDMGTAAGNPAITKTTDTLQPKSLHLVVTPGLISLGWRVPF